MKAHVAQTVNRYLQIVRADGLQRYPAELNYAAVMRDYICEMKRRVTAAGIEVKYVVDRGEGVRQAGSFVVDLKYLTDPTALDTFAARVEVDRKAYVAAFLASPLWQALVNPKTKE